jgi:hypothetical protein
MNLKTFKKVKIMIKHRDSNNPRVKSVQHQNPSVTRGLLDHLVRSCVAKHTPEELALGYLRYETLRRVDPRTFAEMHRRNLAGELFDEIVTEALLSWESSESKLKIENNKVLGN